MVRSCEYHRHANDPGDHGDADENLHTPDAADSVSAELFNTLMQLFKSVVHGVFSQGKWKLSGTSSDSTLATPISRSSVLFRSFHRCGLKLALRVNDAWTQPLLNTR